MSSQSTLRPTGEATENRTPTDAKDGLQPVFDALNDPDCRTIIRMADEPMTASELADACDRPISTMYRKVELLVEASLLESSLRLGTGGKHPQQYERPFNDFSVSISEDGSFEIGISH
jgi:response regulator of citrate/malate metabolism